MDEAVNRRRLLLCLALAGAAAACANAAPLPDPTRPPAALLAGSVSVSAGAGAAQALPAAPQLQSILIAPHAGGRHVVVIDGQTLRPGDKFRGAVLASVSATQVVLQHGSKRQVLTLFPVAPSRTER